MDSEQEEKLKSNLREYSDEFNQNLIDLIDDIEGDLGMSIMDIDLFQVQQAIYFNQGMKKKN